jgi:hypothetical protein
MELFQIPILKELARYTDINNPILSYLHNEAVAEPGVEVCGGNRELNLCQHIFPKLSRVPFIHSVLEYTVMKETTH